MWPFKSRNVERRSISNVPWMPMAGQSWGAGWPAPWDNASLTPEASLRLVPVFGAVRFLADNIASMASGLGVYKLGADNIAQRLPTPPLFANPSINGTLYTWLHRLVISLSLDGNGIGLITDRDYYGYPTAIEWLNPVNVVTLDRAIEGPGSYTDPRWYWWGRPLDPADLLHIPWFVLPWRVRGLSPISAFAMTARTGLAAQAYAEEWFNNGGVPPGTFRNTTQKVLPDDADEIASRYTKRLRTRQPLIYGMDWEYTPIAISPNEARFIETSQLTATHIAIIYGVPPTKIGGVSGDTFTYKNAEQESIDTLTFSFRPWLERLEFALSTCFPRGTFVRFDTSEFLRVDAMTRAQIDALSLGTQQTGWKSRDEVRAAYNLPPAPEPEPAAPPPPGQQQPTPGTAPANAEPVMRVRWATNGHHNVTTSNVKG